VHGQTQLQVAISETAGVLGHASMTLIVLACEGSLQLTPRNISAVLWATVTLTNAYRLNHVLACPEVNLCCCLDSASASNHYCGLPLSWFKSPSRYGCTFKRAWCHIPYTMLVHYLDDEVWWSYNKPVLDLIYTLDM